MGYELHTLRPGKVLQCAAVKTVEDLEIFKDFFISYHFFIMLEISGIQAYPFLNNLTAQAYLCFAIKHLFSDAFRGLAVSA